MRQTKEASGSLRKSIIRLAYQQPTLRKDLLRILLAQEEGGEEESTSKKKGPPPGWQEYIDAVWEGGKKKVTNPNKDGKQKEVAFNTAMKDKSFSKSVMKDYAKWAEKNLKGDKGKGKEAPAKEEKPAPKMQKGRSYAAPTQKIIDNALGGMNLSEQHRGNAEELLQSVPMDALKSDKAWANHFHEIANDPEASPSESEAANALAGSTKARGAFTEGLQQSVGGEAPKKEGKSEAKKASQKLARSAAIRVAHAHPSLREHLIPIILKLG